MSEEDLDDQNKIKNLSKGQKQLLCFARGILKNTHIYLIDEATSNLSLKLVSKYFLLINKY